MKRLISLAFVAVFAAFVACEKENTVSPVKEHKTISATIPAGGLTTRVALTQDEADKKLIKLSWEDTDVITVNGVDFVIDPTSISADGKTADFDSGSAPDPTPDGAGKYNITCSNLPGSFSSQTQAADGSTEHLKYGVIITGADSYADVTFSEAWASQHGATIALSSVLRLRALLPAAIASTVKKVIFKASEDDFAGGKTLEVTLTTPGTAGADNILDVYATLPAAADITTSDDVDLVIQFQVSDNENDKYTAYRKIAAGTDFIKPGAAQYIGIDCSNITSYANASNAGIGTAANPYLIGDKYQMDAIRSELVSGETKYFKLVDDINLQDVSWAPIVTEAPYNRYIYFDGNNKTVSNLSVNEGNYTSMFGVFHGTAKNMTIKDAVITPVSGFRSAVFAGLIGTADYKTEQCTFENVTIDNGTVGDKDHRVSTSAGIFVGEIRANTEMEGVSVVNGKVFGAATAGGLCGDIVSDITVSITTCHSTGTVNSTGNKVGGLIGSDTGTTTISDSYASGSITGSNSVGGFIGSSAGSESYTSCRYTGSSVVAEGDSPVYLGGFCGELSTFTGTISNCYVFKDSESAVEITSSKKGTYVGGFFGIGGANGSTNTSTIDKCYVKKASITGGQYSGGFCGALYSGVSKCYVDASTISVNGNDTGGFAGYFRFKTIEDSYTTLSVSGGSKSNIGGFVGTNRGTIRRCYAFGTVSSTGSSKGSFVGYNNTNGNVNNCISKTSSLEFCGNNKATIGTNCTKNDAINTQATTYGWNGTTIWNLDANPPTLR